MNIKLTKEKLIKLLMQHKWVKSDVAEVLGVGEASIRRACRKFKIDTENEKRKALGQLEPEVFPITKPKSNSEVRQGTFVVIPDTHAQHYVRPVLSAITAFIKDWQPEVLIHLGDLVDNECLMAKVKTKYPAFDDADVQSLNTEFFYANEVLDKLDASVSKKTRKVFLTGNHEFRADLLLKNYPNLKPIIDYKERLRLKDRNWEYHPYLEAIKVGKLYFIHGEYYGANAVRKHLIHYQKNVLYGHEHSIEQTTLSSPMRELPIWGATIGCICNLSPDYQRNKSSQWEHGFAYGVYDKITGDFDVNIKRIIHNKFYAEGKWYVGVEKK